MIKMLGSLILRGVSTYRTYILIGLVVSALIGSGWSGYKLATWKEAKKYKVELEAAVEFYKESIEIVKELNDSLDKSEVVIRSTTSRLKKEGKTYVEENINSGDCTLDPAGLSIWNGKAIRPDGGN